VKKIITNRDIRTLSYERIKGYVTSDKISEGAKIDEGELARILGVSKTPVREALSKLAHDGIVNIIPNRGAFKARITRDDVDEIMAIREALEGVIVRRAAENMSKNTLEKLRSILARFDEERITENYLEYQEAHEAFYALIHGVAKCPRIQRILQGIYTLSYTIGNRYFTTPETVKHSVKETTRILDALEKGDVDQAELIRKELVRFARSMLLSETKT
jgi:DNA-binding GntR family transcriptional regulator